MLFVHRGSDSVYIASMVGRVIREDMGFTLDKATKEFLGTATKVVITKDSTLIVTDGSTKAAVTERVSQIQALVDVSCACTSKHKGIDELLLIMLAR